MLSKKETFCMSASDSIQYWAKKCFFAPSAIKKLCGLFDCPRCPHVGGQQDDYDKRHKNIIVKSSAGVTKCIIAVQNNIHNVPIGGPPQKYRRRYHRRDPVVASEPNAGDAQNPDGQIGKADFLLEWTSCRPSDTGSYAISKKDVTNKAY